MMFPVNPLHPALHREVGFSLATRFPFATGQVSLPIACGEARSLAGQAPIVLQRIGEELAPVVLLRRDWSAKPLFREDMSWNGPHPPLALRYHPFCLIADAAGQGHLVLGVSDDPDCVSPGRPNAFFDDLARPSPLVRAVLRRLRRIQHERRQLAAAASALRRADLLRQLALTDARGGHPFWSIDMMRFRAMPGPDLSRLGARPQDAMMLAAVLDHSRSRLLPAAGRSRNDVAARAVATRAPGGAASFLVDDDFTMSFDR